MSGIVAEAHEPDNQCPFLRRTSGRHDIAHCLEKRGSKRPHRECYDHARVRNEEQRPATQFVNEQGGT